MVTDHHYYPLEVEIANYLANEWSVPVLLGIFAAVCASIVIGTVVIIDKTHPNLPKGEKAAIWWFVICEYCPSIPQFFNFRGHCGSGRKGMAELGGAVGIWGWGDTRMGLIRIPWRSWSNPPLFRWLLIPEPHADGPSPGPVRAAVERIRLLRLSVPDL
jgi:hypothetical protein